MTGLLASIVLALTPIDDLPVGFDSALSAAVDSMGIEVDQLDFDRHWATGVAMPDSTVLRALQGVMEIPDILRARIEALPATPAVSMTQPLDSLVALLGQADSTYARAVQETGGLADSLTAVLSHLWSDEDNPGPQGGWGAVHASRGLDPPPEYHPELDTLVRMMERWNEPDPIPAQRLLNLAAGIADVRWPERLDWGLEGIRGAFVAVDTTGPVRWVVLGRSRNVVETDAYHLVIDLGGDDVYEGNCAGAVGCLRKRVSMLVDLEGDDVYRSPGPVAQGSALVGLGVLVDLEGDDTYTGGPLSQGSGMMGQGLLADLEGDDVFRADYHSQAAATLGKGELLDFGGDDRRAVTCFGQGFGGPVGEAVLMDSGGHDCYLAGFAYPHEPLLPDDHRAMAQGFAMGLRPFCAGGIGLLADLGEGNDTYRAEVFGQGAAYFYGLGMLYDQEGQDSYQAAQYSQGSGIHLASGCLWDGGGDDSYLSRNGPAQGSAHDLSTGFLLDASGDDWYCSDGGQGLALTNSVVVFADLSGSDTYVARGGQGEATWSRGSSGAAVFLDLADPDRYLGLGSDSTSWRSDGYGSGMDVAEATPPKELPQEEIGDPESLGLDSLFSVASEWAVSMNRRRVLAHREELASRGRKAVEYVIQNHLDTWRGLELRALEKVFEENEEISVPLLLDSLRPGCSDRAVSNAVYFLGKLEAAEAVPTLDSMLLDGLSTGLSCRVIEAAGRIGSPDMLERLHGYAESESSRLRREVAVALGRIACPASSTVVRALTEDGQLDVRSAAERAMEKLLSEQ
ncbi:hypothetical protein GF402_01885 [Candidatus Fermentibacteria bacterium]|nr:hypothetical protein [Candidatus Fermentibacteria bacterium]